MSGQRWMAVLGVVLAALIVGALATAAHAFTVTPSTLKGTVGQVWTFAGTVPSFPATWEWDLGDGTILPPSPAATVQAIYKRPGTYVVVMTRKAANTNDAIERKQIVVLDAGTTTTSTTVRPTTSTTQGEPGTTTTTDRPPLTTTTAPQPTTTRPSTTTVPTTPSTTTTLLGPKPVVTPARMPTGKDITIRLQRQDTCRWWDGRTATQAERASMYLFGVATMMAEGLTYAKYSPYCVAAGKANWGTFQTENLRLRSFYVDARRDSNWGILSGGCTDYNHVAEEGHDLQECSTRSEAASRACAQSFWMTGDLLDWTDMRIENGRCVKGGRFATIIPTQEDPHLRMLGMLDYRIPLPALNAEQRAAKATVMALHHQASRARCGDGAPPPPGSVKAAELAFLRTATTEAQKHSFLMIFPSSIDTGPTGWSAQDVCDLAMLEQAAWTEWDACFDRSGSAPALIDTMWGCLTPRRVSHETLHIIGASRLPLLTYKFSDHVRRLPDFRPKTAVQWLACFRNGPPFCGISWVPSDWREMLGPVGGM